MAEKLQPVIRGWNNLIMICLNGLVKLDTKMLKFTTNITIMLQTRYLKVSY